MTGIVLLDSPVHATVRVDDAASVLHGDARRFVRVTVAEFASLLPHYPILMTKDADTGAFFCGAMFGFDVGENLFLRPGGGQDGYRPLELRRVPFLTSGDAIAIDMGSSRIVRSGGQALFGADGSPTPYLAGVVTMLRELRAGLKATQAFIATLLELRLVEPIDIDLSFDDGTRLELLDLYTIDADVLRDLPDDVALDLFRRGYLQLAYLMIASLKQIPVLARMRNDRLLQDGGVGGAGGP